MWDLEHDDNYVLTLEGNTGYDRNETIMCLAYNENSKVLAGGTNMGNIALWKYCPPAGNSKVDGDEKWKLQAPATVDGPVRQIEVTVCGEEEFDWLVLLHRWWRGLKSDIHKS